jgi:hypothetical protein
MNETKTTFQGLTHECDDPDCHVPGFVATLGRKDGESSRSSLSGPGDGWRGKCSCGQPLAAPSPSEPR